MNITKFFDLGNVFNYDKPLENNVREQHKLDKIKWHKTWNCCCSQVTVLDGITSQGENNNKSRGSADDIDWLGAGSSRSATAFLKRDNP